MEIGKNFQSLNLTNVYEITNLSFNEAGNKLISCSSDKLI